VLSSAVWGLEATPETACFSLVSSSGRRDSKSAGSVFLTWRSRSFFLIFASYPDRLALFLDSTSVPESLPESTSELEKLEKLLR
jgi:hypothetical protein